ncbi:hypothetical protein BaRGS_00024222 [Batillaria attramentaria]|uniref:Knr4/Smi1-like domain-containing protein n=1 Tax=Batillaria attramentaria TaxID=370345 RepID=A0ABD0KBX9_9CAEN
MSHEAEYNKAKAMVEHLNMGIISHLENKLGVFKVDPVEKRPVERPVLIAWEQRNTTLLPEDLKNFYMTSNGYHLSWSVKMENGPLPLGRLHVNGIGQLARLNQPPETVSHVAPSLNDLDLDSDDETDGPSKPKFTGGFRMFELDPCDGYGKVCLVYREQRQGTGSSEMTSEVWFLDRALCWHYLAATFTDYFRLMFMHLGLPHWQYAFTDIGIPPQAKQWFHLYAPTRQEIDTSTPREAQGISSSGIGSRIAFDPTKVFKGKNDRKSASSSGTKSLSTSSSSQSLVKSSR